MVKRLLLAVCLTHAAFAGRFVEDLQRVYPRGLIEFNPGRDPHPSVLRSACDFFRRNFANGASFIAAEAGRELFCRSIQRIWPVSESSSDQKEPASAWAVLNRELRGLVLLFGGMQAFSHIKNFTQNHLQHHLAIDEIKLPPSVWQFDQLLEHDHMMRSPLLVKAGLSPQSSVLGFINTTKALIKPRMPFVNALPLRLAGPLRPELCDMCAHGTRLLLNRATPLLGFQPIQNLWSGQALQILGLRAAQSMLTQHTVSLVDRFAISPIDKLLTPYTPDGDICNQIGCTACINEIAQVVPARADAEAPAWSARGHLCREDLQAIATTHENGPLCQTHTASTLSFMLANAAAQAQYTVNEFVPQIITQKTHLLRELSAQERQDFINAIIQETQHRINPEGEAGGPAEQMVTLPDVMNAIALIRVQHNGNLMAYEFPELNSKLGQALTTADLTSIFANLQKSVAATLTDERIRRIYTQLNGQENITPEVIANCFTRELDNEES